MKLFENKDEVLDHLIEGLGNTTHRVYITSDQSEEVNEMINKSYHVIESAKLAIRGIYHTK